jgi:hypothetical protein
MTPEVRIPEYSRKGDLFSRENIRILKKSQEAGSKKRTERENGPRAAHNTPAASAEPMTPVSLGGHGGDYKGKSSRPEEERRLRVQKSGQ